MAEAEVTQVAIVEADLTKWGTALNRARLLTQELVKLEEYDLADEAKVIFDECVKKFGTAYEAATNECGNPALG